MKQYRLGQSAGEADWLIGDGALVPQLGMALRSLKEPGTAYRGDPQPGYMAHYVDLPDDNDPRNDDGGVHINSGIPNRAFYLAATAIGGNAWERPGRIWYAALTERLEADSDFKAAAAATIDVAGSSSIRAGPSGQPSRTPGGRLGSGETDRHPGRGLGGVRHPHRGGVK